MYRPLKESQSKDGQLMYIGYMQEFIVRTAGYL